MDLGITVGTVPILARVAYHFDFNPKLDLYLVGKIGYVLGMMSGDISEFIEPQGGIGFGFDIGAAFYFTANFGIFAEAGFDRYMLGWKYKSAYGTDKGDAPFSRFATVGISAKF